MPLPKRDATRMFARPVYARLRRLCLACPGTVEATSWNHPNFRVGKTTFCAFEIVHDRPSVAFKVDAAEAGRLARQPEFFATPYGRGRWVSRWVDQRVDWDEMTALVARSHRHVAPKRAVRS
jgi:predicted DNA-binding protein (MmcQ/YjbR family)